MGRHDGSVAVGRRMSAIAALGSAAAVIGLLVVAFARHPVQLLIAIACVVVAIAAAAYALTRTGARRLVATLVVLLAVVTPVVLVVAQGRLLLVVVLLIASMATAGVATRYALGRDLAALKRSRTPGTVVGPARRPALIVNPKSGGGKVDRYGLVEEAGRRGIEPIVLRPGDDLVELARAAIARGADVLGMAGGDGSQALVAGEAMRHDVAFVCVPAGTRNHLAMDLGLDREDLTGARDAFGGAVERRVDLGMVGDRIFVNNASFGLYAKIVQSPDYRNRKMGTALELLPQLLGPDAAPFDLRFTGPDGTEHPSAHLVLVSNGRYELGRAEGFGSRRRMDAGRLGIVAATIQSPNDVAGFARAEPSDRDGRRGWLEWSAESFEVRSGNPVEVGIDGESMLLDPPIRFRTVPRALRVRIPTHAPGYSPAAAAPSSARAALTALLRTARGWPVAIDN